MKHRKCMEQSEWENGERDREKMVTDNNKLL